MQETQVQSLDQKITWKREQLPIPIFLLGEAHGRRNLAGYSPWGCKEWHDWAAITLIFHLLIHDKKGISPLRYFRNRSTYVCTTDFQQKCKGNSIEKGWSFQQMVLERWDIAMQRNKFLSILMPCSKIIVKYVIDLKVKLNIVKLSEENVGEKCRTLLLC